MRCDRRRIYESEWEEEGVQIKLEPSGVLGGGAHCIMIPKGTSPPPPHTCTTCLKPRTCTSPGGPVTLS